MNPQPSPLPWAQPEWLAEAHAWIADRLAHLGRTLTGPIEQMHVRSWSTILRAPTLDGFIYFKAAIPLLAREPALTQVLYRLRPDCTLPVLAADLERGWMLVPDGGPLLRASLHTLEDLGRVEGLMPLFASLQIDMIDHREELPRLVPFDRRPELLPDMFEELLSDLPAMRIGDEDGLSQDQHRRLLALAPRYRDLCDRLAAGPIPSTLHHDDFHDGNIFSDGEGQRFIISDWGESCLAHPFCSLLIFLRSVVDRVGIPYEDVDIPEAFHPTLARLRDLYLEPWQRFAPHAELVEIFNLAWRAGMVNRALTWHAIDLSDPDHVEYSSAVPSWLGEFLTLMEIEG